MKLQHDLTERVAALKERINRLEADLDEYEQRMGLTDDQAQGKDLLWTRMWQAGA